jgi:quercetin dioxygenase-like cupin family protein
MSALASYTTIEEHLRFSPDKLSKNNVFDSEGMFCDIYCFESGHEQKAHAHPDSDKVYFVLEGQADVEIGDEVRRLMAGGLAHAGPGVAHGISNPGPDRLKVLVFMAPKP